MEGKSYELPASTVCVFILALTSIFNFYPAIAQELNETHSISEEKPEFSLKEEINARIQVSFEEDTKLETYIVHLELPDDKGFTQLENLDTWYNSFLPISSNGDDRMVHMYSNVFNGFAARLSREEAKAIEKKEGVLFARPQRVMHLHTTHSPNFLGLHKNLGVWKGSNYGKGVIIGVVDTGITPGHPSFSDEGLPPPPAKWKGKCEFNGTFCNNKLIGARNFVSGKTGSAVDRQGHGTHTSSTAAGNFVKDASVFGNAKGTAVGMAPLAHLAMYKACELVFCADSDILAAIDAAVGDGVDVISISLGGGSNPFFSDGIAIGAFSAIRKEIFVSCSAGNEGPFSSSLSNEAPWVLTVGASIIDRNIRAAVLLGNKDFMDGETLFQPKDFSETPLPLVFPGSSGNQDTVINVSSPSPAQFLVLG